MAKAKQGEPVTVQDRITALGKQLFACKRAKEKLEEQLKAVNGDITRIATVELSKLMEDSDVEKISIKGCGTVYLAQELYASVLADDRPKLYEWMRDNGHGALVKDWVFPQTLTAFCKEQLGEGRPLPTVVKATYIPTAKTRAK